MPSGSLVMTDLADDAPITGALFKDLRFFVLQRCPQRSTFVDQIRRNGGEMVNLEKNADIIIADHVRKDNPPGSCSYTFIEKSMANGAVENKEDHLAAPKERELRAVGATETRGKSTRIPFTKEDDEYLHRFVMMHPSLSKKGNELYKKLELANDRHSYQSWRDRWIKYVGVHPPNIQIPEHIAQDIVVETSPAQSTRKEASPMKLTRTPHTKEDDEYLYEFVIKHRCKEDFAEKGDLLYKQLESENDRHSYQSWRDRWIKYVSINPPHRTVAEQQAQDASKEARPARADNTVAEVGASSSRLAVAKEETSSETETTRTKPNHSKLSRQLDRPTDRRLTITESISSIASKSPAIAATSTPSPRGRFGRSLVQEAQIAEGSRRSFTPVQGQGLGIPVVLDASDPYEPVFTEDEIAFLKKHAPVIQNIIVGKYVAAWNELGSDRPQHTPLQWRAYYESYILPWYEQKEAEREEAKKTGRTSWRDELGEDSATTVPEAISDLGGLNHEETRVDEPPLAKVDASSIQPQDSEKIVLAGPVSAAAETAALRSARKPQILPTFKMPAYMDMADENNSSKSGLSPDMVLTPTTNGPIIIETEAHDRKRQRTSEVNDLSHSQPSPVKKVKIEEFSAMHPKIINPYAQLIARRSASLNSSRRVSSSPGQPEVIDLLSDDDEAQECDTSKTRKAHGSDAQIADQSIDDGYDPLEDTYGPGDQLMAEAQRVTGNEDSAEDASNFLDASEETGSNEKQDMNSVSEASMQDEANSTFHVFEDETLPTDEKENYNSQALPGQPLPMAIFADAEEGLLPPLKAFANPPVNFQLLAQADGWAENIQVQEDTEIEDDDDEMPPIRTLPVKSDQHNDGGESDHHELRSSQEDGRMIDIVSQQSQASEAFEYAREQMTYTTDMAADTDGDEVDEDYKDSISVLGIAETASVAASKAPEVIAGIDNLGAKSRSLPASGSSSPRSSQLPDDNTDNEDENITSRPMLNNLDTQGILDLDTPMADFDIPSPQVMPYNARLSSPFEPTPSTRRTVRNHSFIDSSPPTLSTSSRTRQFANITSAQPHRPSYSSPRPPSTKVLNRVDPDELQAFMEDQIAAGYTREHVSTALFSTTMDLRLARSVLGIISQGKPLPRGIRGVWNKEDDKIIQGHDAASMERLATWHGRARYDARLNALEVWGEGEADG